MQTPLYTASVVGGGAGGGLSLNALAASDWFSLKAVADLRADVRESLAERFSGIQTYATHEEMFADCPTDVVCVSTYPPTHEEVTLAALGLPLKGILVEKPLGHTAASGRRILTAIQERSLPIAVPHGLLSLPTPQEIFRGVPAGDIGPLRLIEIQCRGWDIINAGIHWLDFCLTANPNDPPQSVMCLCDDTTRTFRDGMQVETEAVTSIVTQNGVRYVMHTGDFTLVNAIGPNGATKDTAFRILGDAGVIEFYGWENGFRLINAAHPGGEWITPPMPPVAGHRWHLENMAAQIETGKPDYRIAADSLSALELCEAAYLSNQHHCKVTFPLADFAPPVRTGEWSPGKPYSGHGGGRDGRKL